jgi:hypothetical protein
MAGRAAAAPFSTASGETVRATLFPGDGIGPEIAESVKQVRNFGFVYPDLLLYIPLCDHDSHQLGLYSSDADLP